MALVAAPQGTWLAQATTLTPDRARSLKPVMRAGFPGGTTMVSVFVAKLPGSPATRSSPLSLSMFRVSAEAKTSAGAPWVICVTRSAEPAKLRVTSVPGLAASNFPAMSVKAVLSDAAAKTVTVPAAPDAPPSTVPPGSAGPPSAAGEQPASASARTSDYAGEGAPHAEPLPCGVSMMTVVALTTAVATEPSSRPRSRTASLLISETTRNGPH